MTAQASVSGALSTDGMVTLSRFAEDEKKSHKKNNLSSQLREAQRQTGIKPLAMVRDYLALRRSPGRLSIQDYFLYRLYDNARFSFAEKQRFVAGSLHWPMTFACNDTDYVAVTEDKWLFYSVLHVAGISIPETLAVIDATQRRYGATRKIASPSDLRDYLQSETNFPLFFKANDGICSFGAFKVTGFDGSLVFIQGEEAVSVEQLFERVLADHAYLVQTCVMNHAAMTPLTDHLATVRMVNFMEDKGCRTPFAALKLPANGNVVDNFWRDGNILADVDPGTGILRRAISGKGPSTRDLATHPASGAELVGFALPYWRELLELNDTVTSMFTPVRYSSLDIAITDTGPVVIEMNTGGSMELPQLASGRGFLTDENIAFFRKCGYRFKGDPKRRSK
jgi:Sugar-transfer associated ATP-grasp